MPYDLPAIERFCRAEDLSCERKSPEEIVVAFDVELSVVIANATSEEDLYLGLSDGTWHTHGDAIFMTGSNTYVEFGPIQVLAALKKGTLLVKSRFIGGELKDRWLFHRDEKQDFRYFEPNEFVTVRSAQPHRNQP